MAKQRISPRLRVILVLLAVLTGLAVVATAADTTDWTWLPTAVLPTPTRIGHTATLVNLSGGGNGVLVVGGMDATGTYQPVTSSNLFVNKNQWSFAPSLKNLRLGHTATLLQDGKTVLVAGGWKATTEKDKNESIVSCELIDSTQNQGTGVDTDSLKDARTSHTATLLQDGQTVLVTGGVKYDPKYPIIEDGYITILNTSELYAGGVWTRTTGTMAQPREAATATLLPDGKVLVVGGAMKDKTNVSAETPYPTYPAVISCELYDPKTQSWQKGPDLKHPRVLHTATLLYEGTDPSNPNYGKVLVAGGQTKTDQGLALSRSYEIYDPTNGWYSPDPAKKHLQIPRAFHTATLLQAGPYAGKVMLAGGTGADTFCEVYDPDKDSWKLIDDLNFARSMHAAVMLFDDSNSASYDQVLVVGGGPNQCEIYQPETPATLLPAGVSLPARRPRPGN
jgi:hypothetical protein